MEITGVDTYTLRVPIGRTVGDSRLSIEDVYWIIVELQTDTGQTGTGWMGSLGFAPDILSQFVDSQFANLLVGRDPFESESIREDLRRQTIYYGEQGMSAWPRAAIDVALWDLQAKAADEPLFRFLGGSDRRIDAYASSMDSTHERSELSDLHRGHVEDGFDRVKTKVGNKSPQAEAARVRTIRDAVGDEIDIFVDANQAWTVAEATEIIDVLNKYDISWIEEPLSEYDLEGHRRLTDKIEVPLASGEMFYRPERFRWLLERGGVDLVQPDLIRSGGVTGQLQAARLASSYNVPFASHFYYAISGHVVSAAPNGRLVEYIPEYDIAPILEEPPSLDDGTLVLPDRPGHGYRIDDAARERYEVSFE